jgi:hypothetical protein
MSLESEALLTFGGAGDLIGMALFDPKLTSP